MPSMPASIPMARKMTRIGMPRREEKELNKILQVTKTEPRINRLMTAAASNVHVLPDWREKMAKSDTILTIRRDPPMRSGNLFCQHRMSADRQGGGRCLIHQARAGAQRQGHRALLVAKLQSANQRQG